MVNVRRVYVYLVCLISLQTVTWALINLLRDLLTPASARTELALPIALIVIGLPLYLAHWIWAQRSASKDVEERGAVLRRAYLYTTLALLLLPALVNLNDLILTSLRVIFQIPIPRGFSSTPPNPATILTNDITSIVILALVFAYHQWTTFRDARVAPETETAGAIKRFYILLMSAIGLSVTAFDAINLLRWLLYQFGAANAPGASVLVELIASLVVWLPVWVVFWLWAQNLFRVDNLEERESVSRKVYLYLAVFIGILTAVSMATTLLAGFLRALLALRPSGDFRDPLSILIGAGLVWGYHSFILRRDAARAVEAPRQAGIRRLYLYLIAGVGLTAFLIGTSGIISVIIRAVAASFNSDLREQFAWFTAALLAGIFVWIVPWRRSQNIALETESSGREERRSIVRKIYLYVFLFGATMVVLFSAVYIVFRLLSVALGERFVGNLVSDLAHALAFSLIGVGVWIYHGATLRRDNALAKQEYAERFAATRVAVIDDGDGQLGRALIQHLTRELPGIAIDPIGLTASAAQAMTSPSTPTIAERLNTAQVIVGAWTIAVASGTVTSEIARAVIASSARKLLIPMPSAGWEWAGISAWNLDAFAKQAARAVKQMLAGETIKPTNPVATVVLIIAGLIGLCIFLQILSALLSLLFTSGR
ncbi:MAG: DUF3842 family protein [Chloroflexi bacterium]|nr:DUF3842 family protein [Chloroflexota bacterium]